MPITPVFAHSVRIDCDGMINSASAQSDASQWQQLDFMAPVVGGLVSNVLNMVKPWLPYQTWGWLESHP